MYTDKLESLKTLGWNSFFEEQFAPYVEQGYSIGRVALEHKRLYRIYTEHGDLLAEVSGKLRHQATGRDYLHDKRLGGMPRPLKNLRFLNAFKKKTTFNS